MKVRFPLIQVGAFLAIFALAGCASKQAPDTAATETDVTTEADTSGDMMEDTTMGMGGDLTLPTVHFEFDQAVIRSEDRDLLKSAAESLGSNTDVNVTIEGHCDERGSIEYNLALGERRAQAVKSYLVRLGVTSDRLSTISYGEERPVSMGSDESSWAENRRGELVSNR